MNYRYDARAPLLFIAGGADNVMPPSVNESNAKHYKSDTDTDYKEFPSRSHWTCGEPGWEELADYALVWAVEHAGRGSHRKQVPSRATALETTGGLPQTEMLTGNVASQATVPTRMTIPNASSRTRRRCVRNLAAMPAKNSAVAKRTTAST